MQSLNYFQCVTQINTLKFFTRSKNMNRLMILIFVFALFTHFIAVFLAWSRRTKKYIQRVLKTICNR